MPMYAYLCVCGNTEDHFEHVPEDKGCRTFICPCGHTMGPVAAYPTPLVKWANERRPQVIENMSHLPVVVRSQEEHKRKMKEMGVDFVTPKRGMPGCW